MTKKTSAAAPYMMPIFLWSTVVTQLASPWCSSGGGRRPSARGHGLARSELQDRLFQINRHPLLQRLQVGHERVDLVCA